MISAPGSRRVLRSHWLGQPLDVVDVDANTWPLTCANVNGGEAASGDPAAHRRRVKPEYARGFADTHKWRYLLHAGAHKHHASRSRVPVIRRRVRW
jgi:hypothetical protein